MTPDSPDEHIVRSMRAYVYGADTDANWEGCRDHWLKPSEVKWLQEWVKKERGVTVINLTKRTVTKNK